jgi:uncharacterized protein
MTPLHFAAQGRHGDLSAVLLEAGAPVDAEDRYGNTPLWTAVFNSQGDGSAIKALRASGADPEHLNHNGASPVGLARTIANYDLAQFFTDVANE